MTPVRRVRALELTSRARNDLRAIVDFISRDDPTAAARWVSRLIAHAEKVALVPMASRQVPEYGRPDVREVFLRSYRIIFRVKPRSVLILTVLEEHRRLPRGLQDAD
jgi:plasmid stabilization system protein ParE